MRLAKKFGAVVAMAAVCLTMAAPTTANAACSHYYSVYDEDQSISTSTHRYKSATIKYPDGSEEYEYSNCTVTTENYYYNMRCLNCGVTRRDLYKSIDTHSACGL